MSIAEFVLVFGDFMGEWVETPKCWKWRSFIKVTLPIVILRNSSYAELVTSVIRSRDLDCMASDVVISYRMHSRKKVNPTIIDKDVRVLMYMVDVDADVFRPILRINIVEKSFEGPLNSSAPPPRRLTVEDDSNDYENNDGHPINIEYDSMHMEDASLDSQDEEKNCGTGSLLGHSYIDRTNFYCDQTFADKKELKMLLDAATVRQSFDYSMEKSCTKFLKAKYLSRGYGLLLLTKKYETSDKFCIYKYVRLHTCDVEHVTRRHKRISSKLITSLYVNNFWDGKGPSIREIQRIVFKKMNCNANYWTCWKGSIIAKNIIRGTPEHGYFCLLAFFHMVELLNPESSYSIMVNRMDGSFIKYFLAFGACIRGYAHMRKVITTDGTHLYGKYGGVLLSVVAQNTKNHIFPIAFCVVDKENDVSWTFFSENLKSIVEDEPDLCVIFDRHISIANVFFLFYSHAYHGLCMRHLVENLRVNQHYGEHLYLFYTATKAYTVDEFNEHFAELKNNCSEAAHVLENMLGFEKWSRAYFPSNRERHAFVDGKNNKFVPCAEKILRDNKSANDSLYVTNVNGSLDQFTMFGNDIIAKVNLLERSFSCRKFNLVKISCEHAMAALRSKYGDDVSYGNSIYEYSWPIYKVETYLLAYSEAINVVPQEAE